MEHEIADAKLPREEDELQYRRLVNAFYIARMRLGLNQRKLAARMGTTQSGISEIEGGKRDLYLETAQRLAGALGRRLVVRMYDIDTEELAFSTVPRSWALPAYAKVSPMETRPCSMDMDVNTLFFYRDQDWSAYEHSRREQLVSGC